MLRGANLCGIEAQISEGFTSKQKSALEAQGVVFERFNVSTEAIGGNWLDQDDLEDDLFRTAALTGLEKMNEKEGKLLEFDRILSLKTQVIAGINFDLNVALVNGAKVAMRVFRSYNLDWELVDYEYVF